MGNFILRDNFGNGSQAANKRFAPGPSVSKLVEIWNQWSQLRPLLLLVLRLMQGFSVGGEYTGSVSYLVETAPQHRRGFAGSFANFGSTAGMLLAAAVAAATVTLASPAQLESWAWRVPFLLGGAIAACGYFLRRRLRETGYRPLPARPNDPIPLKQAITLAPGAMICAVLFTSGYGIVNYLSMVFLPVYASEFGTVAESQVLQINTAAQAVALLLVPIAGWATDHLVRRRTLLIAVFIAEAAVAWACFTLAGGRWGRRLCLGADHVRHPACVNHGSGAGDDGGAVPERVPHERLLRILQYRHRHSWRYGAGRSDSPDRRDRRPAGPGLVSDARRGSCRRRGVPDERP